ncbi:MAG: hypothetical protein IMW92_01170 [Bacillales bacterium]|nr:hypothetical protein [Bacillales bacterium]
MTKEQQMFLSILKAAYEEGHKKDSNLENILNLIKTQMMKFESNNS